MAADNPVVGVANAMILSPLPPLQFSQVTAQIRQFDLQKYSQAQTHVVKFAKQIGLAQAQAEIV